MTTKLTHSISLIPVRDGLWRVTARSGTVLGHVERRSTSNGDRFTARRLVFGTLTREVGEFWHLSDASDCFR
ncbi:hypothetical protein E3T55_01885 [Cryobacterium frigoriphilum]|uniref:DNA mismatch repair protein n=1 Tax=Cryobacterium frigoriphilum TaxID=1259150 RepID=A0A4R9AAE6_9MICO|nr:hypothetical protein [Cryobacterium frigoriphilum]TFD55193.1 hypothetical protein E3T55_01885 [Cryobacterium frigoriphilum]